MDEFQTKPRNRRSRLLVGAIVVVATIVLGGSVADGAAPTDWNAAYRAAQLGDVIEIDGGTYPAQSINYDPNKASETDLADVTFRAKEGERVVVQGAIKLHGARHITFKNISFEGGRTELRCLDTTIPVEARGHHVVDVHFEGGGIDNFLIRGGQNVSFRNLEAGPSSTAPILSGGGDDPGGGDCSDEAAEDITFDNVLFHDMLEVTASSHMECILIENVTRLTIRRSTFHRCSVFDILMKQQGWKAIERGFKDIVIESNFFGHPTASIPRPNAGATSLSIYPAQGLRIEGNSFGGALLLRTDADPNVFGNFSNTVVRGNLIRARGGSCTAPGVTWQNNIYIQTGFSGKCPGDIADGVDLEAGWVDPDTSAEWNSQAPFPVINYHLKPGAFAIDKVTPVLPPDIDGQTRPIGAASDAGGDEFGSVTPPPPPKKQCADGIDNDGDQLIDLQDPGCSDVNDDSETPDPPPPPPACPGTTLPLTKIAEDATTVTFRWTAVPGVAGYRFSSTANSRRPNTWDVTRTTVRFAKGATCYRVEALGVIADGGATG
jgi:hypothetical protein